MKIRCITVVLETGMIKEKRFSMVNIFVNQSVLISHKDSSRLVDYQIPLELVAT